MLSRVRRSAKSEKCTALKYISAALALATLACSTLVGSPNPTAPHLPLVPSSTPGHIQPTAAPQLTPTPAGLLPAPLYFVNQTDQQIWRLEPAGSQLTQITKEATPITGFDISPVDGRLAYVSNNNLIVADLDGSHSRTLVTGGALDPNEANSRVVKELGYPHWSPDGLYLSFGLNGVNIIDVTHDQTQVLKQSDPVPNQSARQPSNPVRFYLEGLWSPDGKRMLINYANYPEGGAYLLRSLVDGKEVDIKFSEGSMTCCNPAWTPDSQSIYFSNDSVGLVSPGLWRVAAATGAAQTLIAVPPNGQDFPLVSNARVLANGKLYYFYTDATVDPQTNAVDWPAALTLNRSDSDGLDHRTALRTDTFKLTEVLWALDGRGAVIVKHSDDPTVFGQGPLMWVDAANRPGVPLPASGSTLRWGK